MENSRQNIAMICELPGWTGHKPQFYRKDLGGIKWKLSFRVALGHALQWEGRVGQKAGGTRTRVGKAQR